MAGIEIAIKIGTSHTSIFMSGNGIVLHEPTYVAFSDARHGRTLRATGRRAKLMLGKTPEKTTVISPISAGVITDYESCSVMMRDFISKIIPDTFFSPKIKAVLCVPCGLSFEDRKSYEDVCLHSGVNDIVVIESIVAAAVGANLPVNSPNGGVCVNIGGGTTDIAVMSLGGIVSGCSVNIGGQAMDEAVKDMILDKYRLNIGVLTAEKAKEEIASLYENDMSSVKVSGMDAATRSPSSATIKSQDVREVILPLYNRIANQITSIINVCPAELGSNVYRSGIMLTGGGSKLPGLDRLFKSRLNLPVKLEENPDYTIINGAGRLINDPELLAVIVSQN